jgi:hypothetical protein
MLVSASPCLASPRDGDKQLARERSLRLSSNSGPRPKPPGHSHRQRRPESLIRETTSLDALRRGSPPPEHLRDNSSLTMFYIFSLFFGRKK